MTGWDGLNVKQTGPCTEPKQQSVPVQLTHLKSITKNNPYIYHIEIPERGSGDTI